MNFPMHFPELATPRLTLRELRTSDVEALFSIYADEQTMRYWSTAPHTDPTPCLEMLQRDQAGFTAGTAIRWGIVLKATQALIGTCTLYKIDRQNRRAEIGYILHRAQWGRGFMQEALAAMLDYGFNAQTLNLHRVEADIHPDNEASVRALERQGFQREGLLRERWIVNGEVSGSLMMGLLASDRRTNPRFALTS